MDDRIEEWDDCYDGDWVECWKCDGEGFLEDSCTCEYVVDICFCETPEPQKCRLCGGEGGWKHGETE